MRAYIVARLLQGFLTVVVVSMIAFSLVRIAGDPAILLLPPDAPSTREHLEQFRESLGLNDPLPWQYARFVADMLRGDFGTSTRRGRPTMVMVLERLPATAELAGAALLIASVGAILLGTLTAFYRSTWIDQLGTTLVLFGQSFPNFWLGLMLILLFAVKLRWLPPSGRMSIDSFVLPALTLAAYPLAQLSLLVRTGLIEVMGQEYITVARAKGLSEPVIVARHAFKNIAIPLVTVIGLEARYLVGGTIIVETVFAWPGLGLLMIQAVETRDFPVLQTAVLFLATVVILINLMVDLLYVYLDPRVRLG